MGFADRRPVARPAGAIRAVAYRYFNVWRRPALLSRGVHVLMENRHGLYLGFAVDQADGYAEGRCAALMLQRTYRRHEIWPQTIGADAGYREGQFLSSLEAEGITPHVWSLDDLIRG